MLHNRAAGSFGTLLRFKIVEVLFKNISIDCGYEVLRKTLDKEFAKDARQVARRRTSLGLANLKFSSSYDSAQENSRIDE